MTPSLQQIRYFVAVAEELNFTRAAERVFLSQPALTQQIQKIEQLLGTRLLERDKRSVSLTSAGKVALKHAKRTLSEADHLVRATHEVAEMTSNRLRIGYMDSSSFPFLPPAIRQLRQMRAGLQVERFEMFPEQQLEAILAQSLDVGFAPLPVNHPNIRSMALFETHWVIKMPQDHSLANLDAVKLEQLSQQSLVMVNGMLNPPLVNWFLQCCQTAGFNPNIVFEAGHSSSALDLVQEGVGVFIACSSSAGGSRTGLVSRPLTGFDSRTTVGAIWRDKNPSLALGQFLEVLKPLAEQPKMTP